MATDLLIEENSGILTLTLNRPEARNAMTLSLAQGIAAALDEFERRDELRVAIITGAGGHFCAGMDLKGFLRGERPSVPGRGFGGITEAPPAKPLIAAVEGYALAGGFELVLACDLVVAATATRFGLPEVKRGLVAAAGGLFRLPQRLPYHVAMEYILTAEMMPAEVAYRFGLVNRIVPDGEALAGAMEFAHKIMANGPLAVAASKRIVTESADWSIDEKFSRQRAITAPVFESEDAQEGARAFAEKRLPVWQGR